MRASASRGRVGAVRLAAVVLAGGALPFIGALTSTAATGPCPTAVVEETATGFRCTYVSIGEGAFITPPGVSSVRVTATGGRGGVGNSQQGDVSPGGSGDTVAADVAVSAGSSLYVEVGGNGGDSGNGGAVGFFVFSTGGANGGGLSGGALASYLAGGGGGGATDVRTCSAFSSACVADSRVVVAGGGAGGGGGGFGGFNVGGAGGAAGLPSGGGGGDGPTFECCEGLVFAGGLGAGGGSASAGGAGGAGYDGASGTAGSAFRGGAGGSYYGSSGGGGGGGWYGGGGGGGGNNYGGSGGGGGGSSYVAPAVASLLSSGVDATRGPSVVIEWTPGPVAADQTIDFGPLADKTMLDSPVTVGATASSGLPVAFSSSTPEVCSVDGADVTLLGPGQCTIQADQAGDDDFYPAPSVSQGFTVSKVGQTIDFGPLADKEMLDSPVSVGATASSGLPVTFTSTTPAVCSVDGSDVTFLAPGDCMVQADQAGDSDYSAAPPVTQSFAVSKHDQTIDFGALNARTLLESPFGVSASASSGLDVSFGTTTPDVCTADGSDVSLAGTGTCTVSADQAGDADYNPAPRVTRSFNSSKAAQTIDFGALAAKTMLDSPVTVGASATSSSGLPVSFSTTTSAVCSVDGTDVTLLGPGDCMVQADQAGDFFYDAAPPVTRTFAVSKVDQTIDFGALADKTMLESPVTVGASASSGLPVSFSTTTPSVCTWNGSAVVLVVPGKCTVQADQAGDSDYNPAPAVTKTFTVTKAAQTIDFGALADKTTADSPVAVGASASSGLPVSFTTTTPAVCTVTAAGTAVTLVAAGLCMVKADQAGDSRYTPAPSVSQSFNVARPSQTITFGPLADKTMLDSPVKVSATASSGLAVAFSSTTPSVCTAGGKAGATITLVAPGLCTVKADQAGNASFGPAPSVSQSFTVAKAAQTIAFAPLAGRTYGTASFSVSATASSGLAVAFSTTTPSVCTVGGKNGAAVTMTGVGVCTVKADQAGNSLYGAAPSVTQSFTVSKANQTITFGQIANKRLGQSPVVVSASASSGLAVAFSTTTPGVCTSGGANGATITLVASGTCTVVANQGGSAVYNPAASVVRSFTVKP